MLISMKKCYFALMVFLMTLVSVGFTACGDDEPKVADIVGTWLYDSPEIYGDVAWLFQFTKDGIFHQVIINIKADGNNDYFAFHGTYTVKGNELSFVYDDDQGFDGDPLTVEYIVQGDKLMLMDQNHSTFTRVMNSVIEPYL